MSVAPPEPPVIARRALFRLRFALLLFALSGVVGGPWDFWWHTQFPFESFFSPPHLWIYSLAVAAIGVIVSIAANAPIRSAFGACVRIRPLPFKAPPALLILGGGLLAIVLSGVLDELWHARFGLDETRWSVPHAMFGWGLYLTMLGFTSARLALARERTLPVGESVLFGLLLAAFSMYAFLLPFAVYPTPETLRAISGLPTLASQPGAAHTFRIYTTWGIDHTNPLFVPLATLWAGALLGLLRGVDPRARVVLAVTALSSALYTALWFLLATLLGTAGDPRAWLPLPIFPAALVLHVLRGTRFQGAAAWAIAGAIFAALTAVVWSRDTTTIVLAFAGVPLMVAGLTVGDALSRIVHNPSPNGVISVLIVLGLLVPLLFGGLDLFLRIQTP